jgi:hypothetical protein
MAALSRHDTEARLILAHAFGQRYDLPIPLRIFISGGAVIVVLSFLLIAPRPVSAERSAPADSEISGRAPHPAGGLLGTIVLGLLIACGIVGSQTVAENLLPTVFWLVIWIAVPVTCGLIGDWTKAINPFGYLAWLTDRPGLRRRLLGSAEPLPWRFGWWPAAVLFFLTASGELIFNLWATVPGNTAACLLIYAIVSAACGLIFGARWRERGELFSVLFATWGRLGWFRFGTPGRRRFAGGLDSGFESATSRIAFVLLLLVSVNFDGLLATPSWKRLEDRVPGGLAVHAGRLETLRVIAFLALAVAIAVAFGAFAVAAARAGRDLVGRRGALAQMLPSLLPIAFGYLLVHNLQYLLVNGQLLAPLIGNPVGAAWWKIHLPYPFNDSFEPHPHFLPSAFYWYLSVLLIIAVHVIAVSRAHRDLARRGTDRKSARAGEYRWLVAMVAYTMLSLWLIAQPLIKEKQPPAAPKVPAASQVTFRA